MYKIINILTTLTIFVFALTNNVHAATASYSNLIIKDISFKSYPTTSGFTMTLDGLEPFPDSGCAATDYLGKVGRWESDATTAFYGHGTDVMYSTALMAFASNKKINIKAFDNICSTTSGLFIYEIKVEN